MIELNFKIKNCYCVHPGQFSWDMRSIECEIKYLSFVCNDVWIPGVAASVVYYSSGTKRSYKFHLITFFFNWEVFPFFLFARLARSDPRNSFLCMLIGVTDQTKLHKEVCPTLIEILGFVAGRRNQNVFSIPVTLIHSSCTVDLSHLLVIMTGRKLWLSNLNIFLRHLSTSVEL